MGLGHQHQEDAVTYMEAVLGVRGKGVFVRSCAEDVPPHQRPSMPSLEALRASPHHPVLMTPDPGVVGPVYNGSPDMAQELGLNGGHVEVDSDLFQVGVGRRGVCGAECVAHPAFRCEGVCGGLRVA